MPAEFIAPNAEERARSIKLLVLDVDGVLTNGGLYYSNEGPFMKRFHAHDGVGIKLAQAGGIEVAIVSGDPSPAAARRAEALGVVECCLGPQRKDERVEEIRQRKGLEWHEIAFVGDDWIDLGCMRRVGLPIAVRNAQPEVKEVALYITSLKGGKGAVREAVRFILTSQGIYQQLHAKWLGD